LFDHLKGEDMLVKALGNTGLTTSAVGLGTWNIGNQWGDIDDLTAYGTVRSAFDHGMRLFDTAESYGIPNGLSEERLGAALAGIRHQVVLVSKTGNWGRRSNSVLDRTGADVIRLCVHASLHRLQTDWLDVVLCHEANIEDPSVYIEGFEALVKEGRVRTYGISTNSVDVLKRFNEDGNCSVVQVDYSLLNRMPEAEFLPYCEKNNIGVMIRGPLAKGLLYGRYTKTSKFTDTVRSAFHSDEKSQAQYEADIDRVDRLKDIASPGKGMVQIALQYVISHPAVSVVIPGAKSADQAADNAEAGEKMLSESAITKLREMTES
jgi:aryl-alcohol dehydrogenase-like predicted oxidoreductase